ncbi:hypothetical protein EC973_000692 [Apophysomyces ossiformis]|uniref:Uncharacterized protein n=1 Tax=Apophysomyces ossiformis TaxID=679940 RepID=A0A8H7BYF3_9FUNG|nr:hypothetical protein EC973_000692 [Apophysomyces ossiformis]
MDLKTAFNIPLSTDPSTAAGHYQLHLDRLCTALLNDYYLCIGEKNYEILEVEAYLAAPHHVDPFCHAHPLQYRSGYWYFHHIGMSKGFRGGTRKGVDITIGRDDERRSAGGLLIRAIIERDSRRVIEGPSLVVDEILKGLKYTNIKDLVHKQWLDHKQEGVCWSENSGFYLKAKLSNENRPVKRRKLDENEVKIYASCRVGLGLTNSHPSTATRLSYVGRRYRYIMQPQVLKKGMIWTIFDMLHSSISIDKIQSLTGVKMKALEKYRQEYLKGQEDSTDTIEACLKSKDILNGGNEWKIRVMSAIYQQEKKGFTGFRLNQ